MRLVSLVALKQETCSAAGSSDGSQATAWVVDLIAQFRGVVTCVSPLLDGRWAEQRRARFLPICSTGGSFLLEYGRYMSRLAVPGLAVLNLALKESRNDVRSAVHGAPERWPSGLA